MSDALHVRRFASPQDYRATWAAMRALTAARDATTPDALWLLEHPSVYTHGRGQGDARLVAAGAPAAVRAIPFVATDRGGATTYHGPGQLVAYVLIDLARRRLGAKALVHALEQAVIALLAAHAVPGTRRAGAPGVYVDGRKIAALGLKITRGASYHGLALNVDMDLAPFRYIDPCGYAGLEATQLKDLGVPLTLAQAGDALSAQLATALGYNRAQTDPGPPHERDTAQSA